MIFLKLLMNILKHKIILKSYNTQKIICGCDEAGRGCLAGPVFAAAVILPKKFKHSLLNDSKKLNKKSRNILREIIEKEALYWSVSKVSERQIEKHNILNSSIQAMHLSIKKIQTDIKSPILEYYPIDFKVNSYYKRYNWECNPILPTIDIKKIKATIKTIKLCPEEHLRNCEKQEQVISV